jgi:Glutathione-dependent formaldehyde-activating enzyme
MHVWHRGDFNCRALRRRPLLPLQALSAPVRHHALDDCPSPAGAFSVTAGEDKLRVWDPGDGWLKAFCLDCGSHTHTISPDDPTLVAIRLGCLDRDPGIRPQAHQFVAYASFLEPLPEDGLPRFPERLGATEPL